MGKEVQRVCAFCKEKVSKVIFRNGSPLCTICADNLDDDWIEIYNVDFDTSKPDQ